MLTHITKILELSLRSWAFYIWNLIVLPVLPRFTLASQRHARLLVILNWP